MTPRIVIRHLTVKSGNTVIINDLNLTLHHGERLTILGETGAGKSILALAILGDLPAAFTVTGSVMVDGNNMLDATLDKTALWGRKLMMLPQEPWRALSPLMNIGAQVAEVFRFVRGKVKHAALNAANAALAQCGLADALHKVPAHLSGGMAQRSAFVCVNATGAEILLADEPTKGLDTTLRQNVTDQLALQTQNGCLLTITHDVDVARQLGGTLLIMQNGNIVEAGPARDILSNPASEYAQQLLLTDWPEPKAMTLSTRPLITTSDLGIKRGDVTLFSNLSLSFRQGEIVGLCGPSGSGKSSLGDALLGLLPATGKLVFTPSLARHQKLKLYQDPPSAFAQHVPLITLLKDVTALHGLDNRQITPLAESLGLSTSLLMRNAEQVSGGELQRVAILRALLLKPQFLVADEPTSRLDAITTRKITGLLVHKCREINCTMLFISHDRHQLEHVCDRVIDISDLKPPYHENNCRVPSSISS